MHCIYCGKDTSQTTSREHVISACFGGRAKLPLGMVCDDCNKKVFSKLEDNIAHNSFFSFIRAFRGPGKRGSISPNKAYADKWVFAETESGVQTLNYLILGEPHVLPYLRIHWNKDKKMGQGSGAFQDSDQIKKFIDYINLLFLDEIYQEENKNLSEGEFIFLYDLPKHLRENKGKFKAFKAKYFKIIRSPSIKEEDVIHLLSLFKNKYFKGKDQKKRKEKVTLEYSLTFDMKDTARYLYKLFINTLAYFEPEIIEENMFRQAKKFVLLGEGRKNLYDVDNLIGWGILNSIDSSLNYDHYVVYKKSYAPLGIKAIISLYGLKYKVFLYYDWKKLQNLKYEMNGLLINYRSGKEVTFYDLLKRGPHIS